MKSFSIEPGGGRTLAIGYEMEKVPTDLDELALHSDFNHSDNYRFALRVENRRDDLPPPE